MKEGWEYKKLSDVTKITHGKNQKEVLSPNGIYPIYGSGGNIMGYAKEYLCEEGTTILGRKGSINNPMYIPQKFWNVDTAFGISAIGDNDGKFIYYFIKSIDWNKKNTGTTLPSLTQSVVGNVIIPVPPLSEQQSIVDYLDSAFAKIDAMKANAEKALNEAKALFQAELSECMKPKEGWEEKTLKEIGSTQTGTTPSKNEKENYGDYIPFIRPSEVNFDGVGNLLYDSEIKLSQNGLKKGRLFKAGSILMVCIGATISKVGFSIHDVSCNQQINVLTPKSNYDFRFIYYAMRNNNFRDKVIKEGTSAQATLPIINKGKWEQLSLHIPIISEQHSIVAHLDALSAKVKRLETIYEQAQKECDALKQALLRQVFE